MKLDLDSLVLELYVLEQSGLVSDLAHRWVKSDPVNDLYPGSIIIHIDLICQGWSRVARIAVCLQPVKGLRRLGSIEGRRSYFDAVRDARDGISAGLDGKQI